MVTRTVVAFKNRWDAMKKIVLLMMVCAGLCLAGDFSRPVRPGDVIVVPQQQVLAVLAAHAAIGNPVVVENGRKKPRYPRQQKYPKSLAIPKHQKNHPKTKWRNVQIR